jgi:tripartite-type tricarboxylate transporter receptor subunit TctC
MPYQTLRDLKPLTLVAKVPELFVVPANSPAKSLTEFLNLARAKPGEMNYASTGPGGMPHLAAELLKAAAKVDMVHVPYSGAAPAMNDLLPGRTQAMFADIPVLLPHVQGGNLRPLAVGSAKRVALLPDVPTLIEQGLPGVEAENWYGIVTPPGVPAPVFEKLQGAFRDAIRDAEVQQKLTAVGAILVGDSPEAFAAYIEAETRKWAEVVRVSGAKLE